MTTHSTELAVLGAGPGGYAAAFLAADLGMQVTLIDREPNPGGVCVYRGCIPSKALLHAAKLLTEAKHASAWGLHFGEPRIDLDKLREWKNQVVAKLTGGTGQLGRLRKVRYIQGDATIVDPTTFDVQTADGVQRVSLRARDPRDRIAAEHHPEPEAGQPARDGFDAAHSSCTISRRRCSWSAAATSGSSSAPSTPHSARR